MKKKMMMNIRKLLAVVALLAPLVLVLNPALTQATEENEKEGHEPPQMADFLFVQNARSITYAEGRLTLKGVNPATVMFSDRPERIAAHMTTAKFVPFWGEGRDSFLKNPPNATLSFLEDDELADVVVELRDPVLAGNDLSYQVTILEGKIPASAGLASLFIDIIGMPLTPYSYAGVERRRWR